jgi:hypothetical protein
MHYEGTTDMTTHHFSNQEIALLREEIEMLMNERGALLQVVGAAAALVANLDPEDLPQDQDVIEAAEQLAEHINQLPAETLQEALASVCAAPDSCSLESGVS